jgi:hypothetical protein
MAIPLLALNNFSGTLRTLDGGFLHVNTVGGTKEVAVLTAFNGSVLTTDGTGVLCSTTTGLNLYYTSPAVNETLLERNGRQVPIVPLTPS